MPQTPTPPSSAAADGQKLDIAAARELVAVISRHMQAVLAQKTLKHRCFSKLKIRSQEFFEFSEHSVLSNLYWGVEAAEAAAASGDERESRLDAAEKMLQVPSSLDVNGATLGIPNAYLAASSYLYLAAVELLRRNEWRAAAHFLQAVSICPRVVCNDLAPGIWESLRPLLRRHGGEESPPSDELDDGAMRWMARRYKPWLMYYQIMSNDAVPSALEQTHHPTLTRSLPSPPNCFLPKNN